MRRAYVLEQVAQAVHADGRFLVGALPMVGVEARVARAHGDVVRFDAEVLEALLNGDADRAAAAPQTHEKVGAEARVVDLNRQPERIDEHVVGVDELLVRRCLAHLCLCGDLR